MMDGDDHSGPEKKAATPVAERRRYPRHECRLEAEVWTTKSSLRLKGTVTDLSISGCYVEMLSPLPVDTQAELVFAVGSSTLHICGKVRTSQSGFGMGVAFTEMGARGREDVRKLTSALERDPKDGETTPLAQEAKNQSGRLTTSSALEAVVRVLLRKGIITTEELAHEFEKSKE